MGNRAVITTKENYDNNGTGIYLHWNGGLDSVNAFLAYCKLKGYRAPETDNYGWSYLATTIGNYFGDGMSIGVDRVDQLDCNNWDNGVYFIENWHVVGRKYQPDYEQQHHELLDMLRDINKKQPEHMQVSDDELRKAAHTYKIEIGEEPEEPAILHVLDVVQ